KRSAGPTPMDMTPDAASINTFRVMARVQFNLFDPETGYFYAGTYGGAKKILSIGGGIDHQGGYTGLAADLFFDWPLGADVLTAQVNYLHLSGTAPIAVAKQDDVM